MEWELSDEIFKHIVLQFGPPSVYLFASRHNAKVTKNVSWFLDIYCWKTDHLSGLMNPSIFSPLQVSREMLEKNHGGKDKMHLSSPRLTHSSLVSLLC